MEHSEQKFHRLQQAILYILVACVNIYSGHVNLKLQHGLSNSTTPDYVIPGPLIFSAGIFLTAALLTFWQSKMGARVAFLASLIAWISHFLSICVFTFLGVFLLFTPQGIFTVLLPSALLYFTTVYVWGIKSNDEVMVGPFNWFFSKNLSYFTKGGIAVSLLACIFILALGLSTQTTTHEMVWAYTPTEGCSKQITFTFVEAPGYKVWVCSSELYEYLKVVQTKNVPVVFKTWDSLGIRYNFEIQQVGTWDEQIEDTSMYYSCRSDDFACDDPVSPLD